MTHRPVFFDPTGLRKRWSRRGLVIAIVAILLAAIGFATTLVDVPPGTPLTVGFYVPWDSASAESLRAHLKQLDWVIPPPGRSGDHRLHVVNDTRFAWLLATAPRRPRALTMVQNLASGSWDGAGTAALLRDPVSPADVLGGAARDRVGDRRLLGRLGQAGADRAEHGAGLMGAK